jgi:hypothetical protein
VGTLGGHLQDRGQAFDFEMMRFFAQLEQRLMIRLQATGFQRVELATRPRTRFSHTIPVTVMNGAMTPPGVVHVLPSPQWDRQV